MQSTAACRDLLSVVFAGELVLRLDLMSSRPVRLLQLGVVPAGVYLFEGQWRAGALVCSVRGVWPSALHNDVFLFLQMALRSFGRVGEGEPLDQRWATAT